MNSEPHGKRWEEVLLIAQQRERAGQWIEAEELYRQCVEHSPSPGEMWFRVGAVCLIQHKFTEAAQAFGEAITCQPDYAEAWSNRGVALATLGDVGSAEAAFRQAAALAPHRADVLRNWSRALRKLERNEEAAEVWRKSQEPPSENLARARDDAIALRRAGRPREAMQAIHRVLGRNPRYVPGLVMIGELLLESGDIEGAERAFRQAVEIDPNCVEARTDLGLLLATCGKVAEAVEEFRRSTAAAPDAPSGHCFLGMALLQLGRVDEAVVSLERAVRLDPALSDAHFHLGNALKTLKRLDEAVQSYENALLHRPDFADALLNLGDVWLRKCHVEQALECFDRACTLAPDNGEAQGIRGVALDHLRRYAESARCYRKAIELAPSNAEARCNLALWHLMHGDWEQGWEMYEWRWAARGVTPRKFAQPVWNGEPLQGQTILVRCEQGFGDILMCVRLTDDVMRQGGRVVLECPRPLLPLLSTCPGVDQLVAMGDPLPAFDVHCHLMSLPRILKVRPGTVPARIPYLTPAAERIERWRRALFPFDTDLERQEMRVGVVWKGNPRFKYDHTRSWALSTMEPLARIPGVKLISLQKGENQDELRDLPATVPVVDLGPQLDNDGAAFADTAAVMSLLDLVVAPDTSAAHLAGALGVRVWLGLAFHADWRWLLGRSHTPWYPTMMLFRQSRPGDWSEVFQRMAAELAGLRREP
ncbi:MAG: tetratricopeptide repeat protein [Pirellulaceae bacterium]